jgi:hypothetical protein
MANLLHTVRRVLKSPEAMRIDFHLGLINVDAAGLTQISSLVAGGWVGIQVVKMDDDTLAQYAYEANTLLFPRQDFGKDEIEEASIVHECIHALHDLRRRELLSPPGRLPLHHAQRERGCRLRGG